MTEFLYRFSALYSYLLDDIAFCFYLSPIFRLLPSKNDTMKKLKHCKKDGRQFRASSVKEQEVLCEIQQFMGWQMQLRSEISERWRFYIMCSVWGDFSIAHGEENGINRHMDTSKHKVYVDAAQQQKLTNFGASSTTGNLN